jgi:hypothetical protein
MIRESFPIAALDRVLGPAEIKRGKMTGILAIDGNQPPDLNNASGQQRC